MKSKQSDSEGWDEAPPTHRVEVFKGDELVCRFDDHPQLISEYAVTVKETYQLPHRVVTGPKPNDGLDAPRLPSKGAWTQTIG